MTPPLLIGNWKSNTSLEEARTLARASVDAATRAGESVWVGVAVPAPWLLPVKELTEGTQVWSGAQNVSATDNGAFTGEVSAGMLKECARFTLIGHSERRAYYGETDEVVKDKIGKSLAADLVAVVCVGEVLEQREAGDAESVVTDQLEKALAEYPTDRLADLVIAYEPVWAIGTGVSATSDDAEQMCKTIRTWLDERFGDSSSVVIQYGGSANEKNAAELLQQKHVGGLLIGGASLKPDAFAAMIDAAASL